MRKVIYFFISFFVCSTLAFSQETKIIGTVVDGEGVSLPSATVLLFKDGETDYSVGSTTDMDGKFQFENLSLGKYRVEVSFMGFKTQKLSAELTQEKPRIRFKDIVMREDAALLSAVEVSAKRSSLQVDIDKKTFLVNESAVSEGMSASEVLKEIPSVDVDVEGNVSLRNNENVEVYINGKPAGLTDENRGDILEQLPAGSIEKVEVITNPSSKFDAEGAAGIINVVLKTDIQKSSYYGSVSGGVSYPWGGKPGGNLGANVNFSKGKWSSFVGVGYRNRRSLGGSVLERKSYENSDETRGEYMNQNAESDFVMNSGFLRLGTDVKMNDRNTLGLSGMFSLGGRDRSQFLNYELGNYMADVYSMTSLQQRNSFTDNQRLMGNAVLSYEHKFRENHTLSTSFNFFANKNENDREYEQLLLPLEENSNEEPEVEYEQLQNNLGGSRNFDVQVDYLNTFNERSKLETGLKYSFQRQQNNIESFVKRSGMDNFIPQPELDNDFDLQQQIGAAYISYGYKFRKFSLQLGLRGELTDLKWTQLTTMQKSTKDPYFNLFPTAFFAYQITEADELQLSYTRRITRPRRHWLNPFIDVSDSTNISVGNPDLLPEFTNSFELNYVKTFSNHTFMASLYYQLMQDVIQRYSWLDGNAVISTRANMTTSHSTGLELILKNRFKYFNLTTNVNLYYYKLNGGSFDVESFDGVKLATINDRESFSWTAQITADVPLPKDFTFQANGSYRSPRATAQGKSLADYFVNLGLKKSFLQKKLSLTLSVRDLLGSRKRRSETWDDNFYQFSESTFNGRTINLNISYSFGNMGKPNKKNGSKSEMMEEDSTDIYEDF